MYDQATDEPSDEDILVSTLSDEALEAAASTLREASLPHLSLPVPCC